MAKYYYGSSCKDALSHEPVEITTTEQLQQYEDTYNVVIRAEDVDDLPCELDIEINSCLADAIEDSEAVEGYINDYLSDSYGYCVDHYEYRIEEGNIHVSNIEWDLEG